MSEQNNAQAVEVSKETVKKDVGNNSWTKVQGGGGMTCFNPAKTKSN